MKESWNAFLLNVDPRPPYKEEKGKRSAFAGFLALLLVPAFIAYLVLSVQRVYVPQTFDCLCVSDGIVTEENEWLSYLYNWTSQAHGGNVLPLSKYWWESKCWQLYQQYATLIMFGWDIESFDFKVKKSDQFLIFPETHTCLHPVNISTPSDIFLTSTAISCPQNLQNEGCSSECLTFSDKWFPLNSTTMEYMPPSFQLLQKRLKLLNCVPGICYPRESDDRGTASHSLCLRPSLASLLSVIGAGFGFVLGLFLTGPAGVRLIWRKSGPPSGGGGGRADLLRGIGFGIATLGYFGVLWSHLSGHKSSTYQSRIGTLVTLSVLLMGLCRPIGKILWDLLGSDSQILCLLLAIICVAFLLSVAFQYVEKPQHKSYGSVDRTNQIQRISLKQWFSRRALHFLVLVPLLGVFALQFNLLVGKHLIPAVYLWLGFLFNIITAIILMAFVRLEAGIIRSWIYTVNSPVSVESVTDGSTVQLMNTSLNVQSSSDVTLFKRYKQWLGALCGIVIVFICSFFFISYTRIVPLFPLWGCTAVFYILSLIPVMWRFKFTRAMLFGAAVAAIFFLPIGWWRLTSYQQLVNLAAPLICFPFGMASGEGFTFGCPPSIIPDKFAQYGLSWILMGIVFSSWIVGVWPSLGRLKVCEKEEDGSEKQDE